MENEARLAAIAELHDAWRAAAKAHSPNADDLFNAYFDAKIELAKETSGFNETCERFNQACDRLLKGSEEMHEIIINGLQKSSENFKRAIEYSNRTIAILEEINSR